MTRGELGGDPVVRKAEFPGKVLYFPDGGLRDVPNKILAETVRKEFEIYRPDLVVSFDPYDSPSQIDHDDHNVAGLVTARVAQMANVEGFLGKPQAMVFRPDHLMWTSNRGTATHEGKVDVVQLAEKMRRQYPSQFGKQSMDNLVMDLRLVYDNGGGMVSEKYRLVRRKI